MVRKKKNIDYAQNGRKEMVISSNGVEAKGSLKGNRVNYKEKGLNQEEKAEKAR